MLPNSIRIRLTLWHLAILTAVLSVCSVIVYGLLARSRMDRLEARLDMAIRVVASSLEHEIEEHSGVSSGEASFRGVLSTIHHLSFPDLALVALRDGAIVGEKADLESMTVSPSGLDRASAAAPTLAPQAGATLKWSQGGRRFVAMRVNITGAQPYLFVGSSSERQADDDNIAIRNAFFLGLPIPLLLSAVGGWWLARKTFSPITAMMDAVEGISATVLDRRLPVPASDDELARLASTFNRLLVRLENSFDLQRQFMADASHELRTPVSVALTAAQVALDSPHRAENEYRDALEVIDGQMRRLGRVVQDMFLLARADSGGVGLEISKFYLDEVLSSCVRAARLLAHPHHITIEEAQAEESLCLGDESLIRQAVMILLDNAIKYSGGNAVVCVSLKRTRNGQQERDCFDIGVADSGPGIPEELQSRVFERLFRIDKARSRSAPHAGGAGLGLPIARWIATVHGGALDLLSSGERGCVFRLRLPACGGQDGGEGVFLGL